MTNAHLFPAIRHWRGAEATISGENLIDIEAIA